MKLIPRAPILAALVGLGGVMATHAAADVNYTGNWWNPDLNGMGMPCVQQNQTIFCTWFLYDGARRGTFLFSSGPAAEGCAGSHLLRCRSDTRIGNATGGIRSDPDDRRDGRDHVADVHRRR